MSLASATARPSSRPARPGTDPAAGRNGLGFGLFVLANAALFIRPMDLSPELQDVPTYEPLIIACLVVSLPCVLRQLSPGSLGSQPITACVLGLLPAVVLSHVFSTFYLGGARESGVAFAKVVVYYLLLVGLVDSGRRLRQFLYWLVVFTVILTVLALLQYHGTINIPSLEPFQQRQYDPETGELVSLPRLCSVGIFNDPNDLCLVLVTGMAVCLYGFGDRRLGALRPVCLGLVGLFGYALILTHSRGGFLALLAALLVLLQARFGWRKALVLAGPALAILFLLFAGRQTSIDLSDRDSTGQGRIQLWAEGLALFRQFPLFGVGYGEYGEHVGLVAHNSFVHCYVELGMLGGTLFTGAFYLALAGLHQLGSPRGQIPDAEVRRLHPFLKALAAGYVAGMLSLTRCYIVPTYMVLGLVAAYSRFSAARPAPSLMRFDTRLVLRLAVASLAGLTTIHVFVRLFVRWA
jgi:O-antigen ligase